MLLDTENKVTPARSPDTRQVEYLLVAMLAAVTFILLFAMGFFSNAAAATNITDWSPAAAETRSASLVAQTGRPVYILQAKTLADRHILIGLTLIAIAAMAATTFSIWRWQLRGLVYEAHNRAR